MREKFMLLYGTLVLTPLLAVAQHQTNSPSRVAPKVAPASGEGELAIKRFQAPSNLKIDLWAAEPLLANPVAFSFDEKGRAYVCETFRLGAGVDDIRGIMSWLDEELASRSPDDREAEMKRHLGTRFSSYTDHSERVRLLEDRGGEGRADHASVFADGFNTPLDGLGAGVLARHGQVWYANIPNLWLLRDQDGDGQAEYRKSLHYGFGVRVGFLGHDLHGPRLGPDGKLYFSVGDRGSNVRVADGTWVGNPDTGCVFRCNPDGSDLEVFAFGLRNPQDLVFDQYGNLFTGDNNSDSGDRARWVCLVEGGDSGWRVGFQFMERPYSRGPFNAERLWYPAFPGQAANIIPPVANLASGPSGVAYFPGTGLPSDYANHFFLVDFRGGAANSGVHTFTLRPEGAGFAMNTPEHFLWGILATDAKFGVDGGLYVSDWVEGWGMTGKGRIYRVHAPELDRAAAILETKELLARDLSQAPPPSLAALLSHPDMRVRQEAQFALANRGADAVPALRTTASGHSSQLARLHAIWGMGQLAARHTESAAQTAMGLDLVAQLLDDSDSEVRAQAAKVLGDSRFRPAGDALIARLRDSSPRVRFFAALAVGKLGRQDAVPALFALLRENADQDPYLRHAGVTALSRIGAVESMLSGLNEQPGPVRLGVLLALRRLQRPEIARFLHDPDSRLVLEAARAINDEPINSAMLDLAALLSEPAGATALSGRFGLPDTAANGLAEAEAFRCGPEAFLRRVLNANFRAGLATTAKALGMFATRTEAPASLRVEALEELGDWVHPSGRDRVIGLWRPAAGAREPEAAIQALQACAGSLLHSAPAEVQTALLRSVGHLNAAALTPVVEQFLGNSNAPGKVRAEALTALATLRASTLDSLIESARKDRDEDLRIAATRLESKLRNANSISRLAATLESGTVLEQQTALHALAPLDGEAADNLVSTWLDRLRASSVPKELQLDILEAAATRSDRQIQRKLRQLEASRSKSDALAPFEPCLFGGDAAAGKHIFFEKAEAQCVRCHKIGEEGGEVGPDLSHVGAQKDRRYLVESIVAPNQQIAQGFESVTVFLKNGDSYAGVLKSETPDEITLNSADTGLLPIRKADIDTRRAALSPMPEGLGQILTKQDLRDLVEYLATQK